MNTPNERIEKHPIYWSTYTAKRSWRKTVTKYPVGFVQSNGNLLVKFEDENENSRIECSNFCEKLLKILPHWDR